VNIFELQKRLEGIRAVAGDPEAAHGLDDDMRRDVLLAICQDRSLSEEELRILAAMALSTDEFIKERWYA
jgi:hypothetical protein